jgi:hypothetical protein
MVIKHAGYTESAFIEYSDAPVERVAENPFENMNDAFVVPFRYELLMTSDQSIGDLGVGSVCHGPRGSCVADRGPFESWLTICRSPGEFDAGSRMSFVPGKQMLGFLSLVLVRALSSGRSVTASA